MEGKSEEGGVEKKGAGNGVTRPYKELDQIFLEDDYPTLRKEICSLRIGHLKAE
jgi:hypothetical protein